METWSSQLLIGCRSDTNTLYNTMMILASFMVSALIAEIVGTIAGFGSSAIFLPLSLFFFDFKTALVLVGLFHIFGTIDRVWLFRKGLDVRLLIRFGLPSVIGSLVGALLVPIVPQEMLKGLLGVFLMLYSGWSMINGTKKLKFSQSNVILGGSISGFIAGLIGTGGALRGAFLSAFGLVKTKYLAEAAAIGLAVDMIRVPIYLANGFLTKSYLLYVPLLFIIAYAGSYIGKVIIDHVPQRVFNRVVLTALFAIGVKFLSDWII